MGNASSTSDKLDKYKSQGNCQICNTTFTCINRRQQCQKCEFIICSKCRQEKRIVNNNLKHVCKNCASKIPTTTEKNAYIKYIRSITNVLSYVLRQKKSDLYLLQNPDNHVYYHVSHKSHVNVRMQPNSAAPIVTTIKMGHHIKQLEEHGNWVRHQLGWSMKVNYYGERCLTRLNYEDKAIGDTPISWVVIIKKVMFYHIKKFNINLNLVSNYFPDSDIDMEMNKLTSVCYKGFTIWNDRRI